jgi:ATP-binding cassette subfamily F protein uup
VPPVLTAHHLSKSFAHRPVLQDVSLAIEPGERTGLIGNNGSGKSTLGKILVGVEEPDGGTVARRRDVECAYLAQEPVLDPALTAFAEVEQGLARWHTATRRYEEVAELLSRGAGDAALLLTEQSELGAEIERLGGWEQGHRVRAMLEHLGIRRPEQRIGELSGGERRRVALARLLVSQPGFAVLDEPTNHLDADTAAWLEHHLVHEFKGALLLVTHDRYFLDHVVTRVFELDRGLLGTFEGNYQRYLELKAERLEHEARVEANRMNVLRRERDWLSRGPAARTTKQKARIQRAEALEETVKGARRTTETANFDLSGMQSSKRVLEARDVSRRFGERTLFEHFDFVLNPGERVGIIGKNGAGKTTLLRTLLQMDPPTQGEVTFGPKTTVMYFDQQRAGIDDDKSVLDNVREGSDKVRLGDEYVQIQSYLERFLFDGAKQRQAAGSLSGGERARLALAKMLRGGANLIVLDEPTNDLDLVTLSTLEEILTSFDGAALVVTHDRYFLDRVATSILSFEEDGRVVRYAGGYEDYRIQRANMDAERAAAERAAAREQPAPSSTSARAAKKKNPLTMAEEKELAALPERIDVAERAVTGLETELNDPALYATRAGEVAGLQAKLDAARADVEALMTRWEALESKREAGA